MAVSRHNGGIQIVSGNHTYFIPWLFLSVAIHLIPAAVIVLTSRIQQRVSYAPVYQVELLTRQEAANAEEAPQREELLPRKEHKVEGKIRAGHVKPKKAWRIKKGTAISKAVKDKARPEDAVSKLREKIAAEDAVERMRKQVREKEKGSTGIVKIAARPPTRVYHYEELDAELKAYFKEISQIVREAWSLPDELRNKGFKTVLSIHIRRDGAIESLWVEEGSGNTFYDDSARRAISKVSPLPPLPKGWKEEFIDLGFNF